MEKLTGKAESIADKRLGPGLLMLTLSMRLIYKDPRAWQLCAQINRFNTGGKTANGVLPTSVAVVCEEVRKTAQHGAPSKDYADGTGVRRIVGDPNRPVLLCGFALPDSRILILMEELGRRHESVVRQAKERFVLTPRETHAVENLLKGWTNKEIANEMRVTEQTVKEHLKAIMMKTATTTRTGLLVTILQM